MRGYEIEFYLRDWEQYKRGYSDVIRVWSPSEEMVEAYPERLKGKSRPIRKVLAYGDIKKKFWLEAKDLEEAKQLIQDYLGKNK